MTVEERRETSLHHVPSFYCQTCFQFGDKYTQVRENIRTTFTNISCAKHFEISLAPLRDWTITTAKSANVHKNCEIFTRSTYFAEIINVFKQSFVRYVNKPCYFGIGFDAYYMPKTLRYTLIFYQFTYCNK